MEDKAHPARIGAAQQRPEQRNTASPSSLWSRKLPLHLVADAQIFGNAGEFALTLFSARA